MLRTRRIVSVILSFAMAFMYTTGAYGAANAVQETGEDRVLPEVVTDEGKSDELVKDTEETKDGAGTPATEKTEKIEKEEIGSEKEAADENNEDEKTQDDADDSIVEDENKNGDAKQTANLGEVVGNE